ncbi:hypothetical protein C8R44DRAFT_979490 [Mycena epipterygia]|nr:hypothetical protein C8R44DRAFT_979490 [Mycena epipterygia]
MNSSVRPPAPVLLLLPAQPVPDRVLPRRHASTNSLRSAGAASTRTTTTTQTTRTNNITHTADTSDTAHNDSSFFSGLSLRKYTGGGGVNNDPKVLMVREKIATAAEVEKEADRALMHARARVCDAMEHQGAGARGQGGAKQTEAKVVSKNARGLGRHG